MYSNNNEPLNDQLIQMGNSKAEWFFLDAVMELALLKGSNNTDEAAWRCYYGLGYSLKAALNSLSDDYCFYQLDMEDRYELQAIMRQIRSLIRKRRERYGIPYDNAQGM